MSSLYFFLKNRYETYILWKRQFIILWGCYTLALISIIRADYPYVDDIGRMIDGHRGWNDFSRYITQILSGFIHADVVINDISPFPQLLAVFFLAFASMILVISFSQSKRADWLSLVAVFPVGISPYFLECLAFKFDAPYMALSVLFSVLPLLFMEIEEKYYAGVVFLSSLFMCLTYQASSGILPLSVLFLLLTEWNRGASGKKILRLLLVSAAAYLGALFIFKFIIMRPIIYDYVSVNIGGKTGLIKTIIANCRTYAALLYEDSTLAWRIMGIAICFSFLRSFVAASVRKKSQALLAAIISLAIGFFLSYGAYLVLEKPSFFPRAMYGFYVLLGILGLIAVNEMETNILGKIVCACLCWSFFVFSLAFGNALAEQNRYDEFRMGLILQDLQKLPNLDDEHNRYMQIDGSAGFSPVVKRMSERYKVLQRLVPLRLHAGMPFGEYSLFIFYKLPGVIYLKNFGVDKISLADVDLPVFKDCAYHTIKANEKFILVELK